MNIKAGVLALVGLAAGAGAASSVAAEPEYATVRMEIDVARPAKDVWARVGGYCDIQVWLSLDCKIT